MSRIAVVVGTRPEVVKLALLIKNLGPHAWIVHSGQHHDRELFGQLFQQFGLQPPHVSLARLPSRSRGEQIGSMMMALTHEFAVGRPDVVIVQGDTNTVNAAAQAANYLGIPLMHVEAGLRSHDRNMPEESNRIVADVLADRHCAPTSLNVQNLQKEGIPSTSISLTGNTVVETVTHTLAHFSETETRRDGVPPEGTYVLATIHRPENTDSADALARVLRGLHQIEPKVLFIAHPRTRAAINRFQLDEELVGIRVIPSVDHSQFLRLASHARLLVSDSGGLQEECTVLKKPLVVVRRSTERPESIDAGFARLVTPSLDIADAAQSMLADKELAESLRETPSPYGDGTASARIADLALEMARR